MSQLSTPALYPNRRRVVAPAPAADPSIGVGGGVAGNVVSPRLNSSSSVGNATVNAPIAPAQTTPTPSPLIGGSGAQDQTVTGRQKLDSAQIQSQQQPQWKGVPFVAGETTPAISPAPLPRRLNADNGISDQVARQMYKVAMNQNPGNLAAGEQQFHETMAKYGLNGRALLDHWHGAPQTDFQISPAQATVIQTPYSMLGPDKSGGTTPPGMPAGVVNNVSMTPPVFGPMEGYTHLPPGTEIAPTAKLETKYQDLGRIRDVAQAPFSQTGANGERQMETNRLARVGEAQMAQAPITPRERFDASTDIGMAAAEAPVLQRALPAQIAADGRQGVADTKAQSFEQNTATKVAGNQKIAETKTGSAEKIADKKAASAKDVQELRNVGAADVVKLRTAVGGKPGDPLSAQQKTLIAAFGKTAATDDNFQPRKFEDRLAEAQKLMKAGAASAQPGTATGAGATSSKNPTRAQARQYVDAAGGDANKAMAAMKAAGLDPTRYAD